MDNSDFHKEIQLIQDCIKRMASNSFMLKGWYISLVFLGASMICGKDVEIDWVMLILAVLTSVFWYLDGFFLNMETLYRWKYEWVIDQRLKNNSRYYFDLNQYNENMWLNPEDKREKKGLRKYIFSKTLIPLYLWGIVVPLLYLVFLIVIYYANNCNK